MTSRIDLNADIGELPGAEGRLLDNRILRLVSSCNIACSGHAGDRDTMRETLRAAKRHGVLVGAHPSYPDKENFGRKSMEMPLGDLHATLIDQIATLKTIAEEEGAALTHVKAHGALYNDAAQSPELANLICQCAKEFEIENVFFLPESCGTEAAKEWKLNPVREGFVDRLYEDNGRLTSRTLPNAVHSQAEIVVRQAVHLATGKPVLTRQGTELVIPVETLCLHGDTAGAAQLAEDIRSGLLGSGVEVRGYV